MSSEAQAMYDAQLAKFGEHASTYKPLLVLTEDAYLRAQIGQVIHNQTEYNQTADNEKMPPSVKQISVPTICHTLMCLPQEIVGVQAIASPDGGPIFYFEKAGDPKSLKSREVKLRVNPVMILKGMGDGIPQDELAYHCYDLATNLTEELTAFAIKEMLKTADGKLYGEVEQPEDILGMISNASEVVFEKIGRTANFVVLPVGAARIIKEHIAGEYDFDALPMNIRRIGTLKNRWVVYINGLETRKAVVGYRGIHPADAGYIYSPNVMFYDPRKEPAPKDKKVVKHVVNQKFQYQTVRPDYFCSIEFKPKVTAPSMADML